MQACRKCNRPTADNAALCASCLDGLRVDLEAVPELWGDLETTRTKQDAIASRQARVSGSRERPLGYRPGALDASDRLRSTVARWTFTIAAEVNFESGEQVFIRYGAAEHSRWLLRHRETIRHYDSAAEMANEIAYAVATARQATDRPPEKTFLGPCDCGADLYVRERSRDVMCRACGVRHSVDTLRARMLDRMREHTATAADIAGGIGDFYGQQLSRKLINKWHSRGRLIACSHADNGDPMFRVGDVLELAATTQARKTAPIARSA